MLDDLLFRGYKGFSDDSSVGFSTFSSINLIIGKNNIGKSRLLDSIQALKSEKLFIEFLRKTKSVETVIRPDEDDIKRHFRESVSGGSIGGNHFFYGRDFIGKQFRVIVGARKTGFEYRLEAKTISLINGDSGRLNIAPGLDHFKDMAVDIITKNLNLDIDKLAADRDMKPEPASSELRLLPDGTGATNMIQAYLNLASLPSDKVRRDILTGLNKIMSGEATFNNIIVQNVNDNEDPLWEVFLEEEEKGMVALSASGSGLRTILLVLVNLILSNQADIYIFEELENNLHPAIQRNLFQYVFQWIEENNKLAFITSHSSVPINMAIGDSNAQIVHVFKDNGGTVTKSAVTFNDDDGILEDLDIRGSDLLQANGIIWVEGPSDRIYLNKWIDLISDGQLIENKHYQIMFYGGRLLAHLEAAPNDESNLISLLLANRNSAIIIDSDRTFKRKKINSTKQRIRDEFQAHKKFCWVTKGKEIENYLSQRILNLQFQHEVGDPLPAIGQYQTIDEYLDGLKSQHLTDASGKDYTRNKVRWSKKIIVEYTYADLDVLDLIKQLKKLVAEIAKWNRIKLKI